jgi:HlyD family secretion protein
MKQGWLWLVCDALFILEKFPAMAASSNHSRRRPLLGVLTALIVAVVIFSGWMKFHSGGTVTVRAEDVVRQGIANVISTNGKIEPVNNFEAHAPAPATVKRVLVKEGDHVKAGQLLVELDDADARAQAARALALLRAAEADLQAVQSGGTNEELLTTRSELAKAQTERDEARRNLAALQRLQQSGGASPAEVQSADERLKKAETTVQFLDAKLNGRFSTPEVAKVQAGVDQARAGYAAAQDLVKNSNIRSPREGSVYQLPVKPGGYVGSGQLLVQVADLAKVQVRAFVDEPEIGRLAKGQQVEIKWDAIPGRVWEGVVSSIPTVVTVVGTRTVGEITCALENADRKLLPNVNVNVSIITARHANALTVSREAVHGAEGKRYVFAIVENRLETKDVQTGITSLTRVEVVQGLASGQKIAMGSVNAQPLRSGMEVKVVER